jgi:V/A-type H+-transporting ATPase subunit D
MARLSLSKSSLQRERNQLKNFQHFLPSLDLKRQQLMQERSKAEQALQKDKEALSRFLDDIGEQIPMLANREVDLTDLARVVSLEHGEENIVGVKLPKLESFEVEVRPYSLLTRPQWVDEVASRLRECVELSLRVRFGRRRVELLRRAVQRVTQRVNLFEKVLIPRTRKNIQRIQIYLGDNERTAVVRSKAAKKKHAAKATVS